MKEGALLLLLFLLIIGQREQLTEESGEEQVGGGGAGDKSAEERGKEFLQREETKATFLQSSAMDTCCKIRWCAMSVAARAQVISQAAAKRV